MVAQGDVRVTVMFVSVRGQGVTDDFDGATVIRSVRSHDSKEIMYRWRDVAASL